MADVKISFIEKEIEVNVDLSLLTWGDLLKLQRVSSSGTSEEQAEELLNNVISRVTGKDAYDLPAVVVTQVLQAIMQRVQGGQKEKN